MLVAAAGASAPAEVPLPPPPQGMRLVAQSPDGAAAASPSATAATEVPAAKLVPTAAAPAAVPAPVPAAGDADAELDEDAAELEQMRALEDVELDPKARSDAKVRELLHRLGYGSALRSRLQAALESSEAQGEVPFALDPVTDIATFDVSKVKDRYDIPVEMQPLVAQYIHFFQHAGRKWFRNWMSRSTRYIPMMQPILKSHGMPLDTVYLAMIESGFSTAARSWAAAVGPWQFISETGRRYGLRQDFWVDERKDPLKATHAAAKFLGTMFKEQGDWYLAWAGYNSGEMRVRRMVERYGTKNFWELSNQKQGFAKETKHYVPKLIACALVARHPDAFGFAPDEFDFQQPLEFDEIQLTAQVDLEVVARAAGTTHEALTELNPELKRWCTPPASESAPYVIRVPKGTGESAQLALRQLPPGERLNFRVHRVKKGDTLSAISLQYASAPEAIMRVNGLRSARSLKLNSDLLVPVPSAAALKAGRADPQLERQIARARRAGLKTRPEDEVPAGTAVAKASTAAAGTVVTEQVNGKTRVTYAVASGDSLWSIAQRFDCSVNELRGWNVNLTNARRGLRIGTQLLVWPGPKASLAATP